MARPRDERRGGAAFNFFHIPPTGRFTIAEAENWVALVVFLVAAVVASSLSELARQRAEEAEQRRREADLAAELARLLLGTPEPRSALAPAAKRIADALRIDSAAVVLEQVEGDERHAAVPLGELGTLLVPAAAEEVARERVAPALEALLRAALEREPLTAEVVETSALRRSDEIKTAVLRSVSHDLRSPLTAIVAAGEALGLAVAGARATGSSWPTRSRTRAGGWRGWSTSCSTSRGCRRAPPSRARTGARSRR